MIADWSQGNHYAAGDLAIRMNACYRAVKDNIGNDPIHRSADNSWELVRVASQPDLHSEDVLPEQWHPWMIYTEGDRVFHNGYIYQANWWTTNDPETSHGPDGSGKPWTQVGPVAPPPVNLPGDGVPAQPLNPAGPTPADLTDTALRQGAELIDAAFKQGASLTETASATLTDTAIEEEISPIILAARNAIEVLFRLKGKRIVLQPSTGEKIKKPSGGYDYIAASPRAPQIFALSKVNGTDNRASGNNDDGTVRKNQYVLTCRWNAEVAVGDTWEDHAATYTVETRDASSGYRINCDVSGYVKDWGHGPV